MIPIIPSLSPLFEFLLPRNISGTDFGTGYGGTVCGFHTRPPRTPQDTPGHPRTLLDSIICMFNILYERVDDGLVLVCWCIN